MADIRPIRTEEDYEAALARIAELMDALSPPEGQIEDEADPRRVELDVLSDLVEQYEDRHYPIDFPGPVAAIEFQMDQMGMTPRDLIPFIGTRAKVSEVLSGKRPSPWQWREPCTSICGFPPIFCFGTRALPCPTTGRISTGRDFL